MSGTSMPVVKKVTFIIGNGFDLGLGMKTSYLDMYDGYVSSASSSFIITVFKEMLSKCNYKLWSDFEIGLSTHAKQFAAEEQLVECVRDFKKYLVSHLTKQEQILIEKANVLGADMLRILAQSMQESLEGFFSGLTPNAQNKIKERLGEGRIEYNFIVFNYTRVFEFLLDKWRIYYKRSLPNVLHIHGSLDGDVVLGVNDLGQLETTFALSSRGERSLIKPIFNNAFDNQRLQRAKDMISQSDVICTYGFAMGATDQLWVDEIAQWLGANNGHHLVAFQYDTDEYFPCNPDEKMDAEEDRCLNLLSRLGLSAEEQILDQLHIPIGHDIFNFPLDRVVTKKATLPNEPLVAGVI